MGVYYDAIYALSNARRKYYIPTFILLFYAYKKSIKVGVHYNAIYALSNARREVIRARLYTLFSCV